jgi:glycerophosphoryl diester phosphodiesterase
VPENTLLAFEQSAELGADGIEFDVQITGDGSPIVFHDATLERMTSGTDHRRIADVFANELCNIPLGQGATIPRFSEVLTWANNRPLYLNVELKSEGLEPQVLVAAVEQEISEFAGDSLKSRLLFSSFATNVLEFAKGRGWPWPLARLIDSRENCRIDDGELVKCGIHTHFSVVNAAMLAQWTPSYTFVNAWTVNAPDEARRLAGLGIDGIITDEPNAIRNVLE